MSAAADGGSAARPLVGDGRQVGVTPRVNTPMAEWRRQRREVLIPFLHLLAVLRRSTFFEVLVERL